MGPVLASTSITDLATLITAGGTLVASLAALLGVVRSNQKLATSNGKSVGQMVEQVHDERAIPTTEPRSLADAPAPHVNIPPTMASPIADPPPAVP